MLSHVPAGEARLKEIAAAASGSRAVLLATDPDREGEAISWHITQELQVCGVCLFVSKHLWRLTLVGQQYGWQRFVHTRTCSSLPGALRPQAVWHHRAENVGVGAAPATKLSVFCLHLTSTNTHVLQRRGVLRPGQVLQRVTFNEVTQKAVKEALQHPRQVHVYVCMSVCLYWYVCMTHMTNLVATLKCPCQYSHFVV